MLLLVSFKLLLNNFHQLDPQICRLIALDKQAGVRPIGVGEVIRRICGKAILTVLSYNIQEVAGLYASTIRFSKFRGYSAGGCQQHL